MSLQKLQHEINGHLSGDSVHIHSSSWAADFNTALGFAGDTELSMIAVLDTAQCDSVNMKIIRVTALKVAGITHELFPEEYLVYGPVFREYCCSVAVSKLVQRGLSIAFDYFQKYDTSVAIKDLERANQVAPLFFHEPYRTSGPDLWLTIYTAELSRLTRPSHYADDVATIPWSVNETRTILDFFSDNDRIDDAVMCNIDPLVDPKTYTHYFPQLGCMIHLLVCVEREIQRRRLDWTSRGKIQVQNCPSTSSLDGHGKSRPAEHRNLQEPNKRKWRPRPSLRVHTPSKAVSGGSVALRSKSQVYLSYPTRSLGPLILTG